jgi:hypothetical protein
MSMTTRPWTAVLCALSLAGPARSDAPDDQLAAARDAHKEAVTKAEGTLVEAFETTAKLIRESSRKADEKQRVLDQLKQEKADFQLHGWYPWSEAMRPALVEHIRARLTADKVLGDAFDKVVDAHTRAKRDVEAATILKLKRQALEPKLVARWELTGTNWNGGWVGKLYSNGHYSDPDGKALWAIERGVVTLVQPESGLPGGRKVLKWHLKESGVELDEVGNNGARSTGKLANRADEK